MAAKTERKSPLTSRAAAEEELEILKARERRYMAKLVQYESRPDDDLVISTTSTTTYSDGSKVETIYRDSILTLTAKLQAQLDTVQGKILKVYASLRSMEERDRKYQLDKDKLEIQRMKVLGALEVIEPEEGGVEVD